LTTKSINERNTTMAERQSMTTREIVAKTLLAEQADFLKEAVGSSQRS
jgi:hypothetical protein